MDFFNRQLGRLSTVEMLYDSALYKYTVDIDIDIVNSADMWHSAVVRLTCCGWTGHLMASTSCQHMP